MDRNRPHDLDSRRRRAAVIAALWTALLFATIPLVRMLQRWVQACGLEGWITPTVMAASLALVALAGLHLVRRGDRPGAADVAWLGMVAVVAGGCAWHLRGRPEEAVHLLEYGVLGWLIFRAIRPAEPDAAVVLSAVLLGTIMGTVDEVIQWITPERFWDLRDVALNGGACVLGAVVAWRLDSGPWRKPQVRTVRLALRLGATLVVLITLCLANTPARVAWYAARVPGLSFLAHPANEMAEYGHLHRLPGVGEFKSRLTREQLAEQDRRRGGEAAAVIDRYPDAAYARFHWDHQGFADPLTYEARVHIFSRDHNLRRARQSPPGSHERRLRATLAYRENQLLEAVFPNTLGQSVHQLDRETVGELRELHDPALAFASRSGAHLMTWIAEPVLRAALLLIALALAAMDVFLGYGRSSTLEMNP